MADWKEEAQKSWDAPSWKEAAAETTGPHPDLPNKVADTRAAPSADQTIDGLAQLGVLAYQKRRVQEAKTLGIPVGALDKLVRQAQARAADRRAELPHWHVEPWPEPVD